VLEKRYFRDITKTTQISLAIVLLCALFSTAACQTTHQRGLAKKMANSRGQLSVEIDLCLTQPLVETSVKSEAIMEQTNEPNARQRQTSPDPNPEAKSICCCSLQRKASPEN